MPHLLTGLSAFPLTPFHEGDIDEPNFVALVERLAKSQVDSVAVLGSTGSYMYLSPEQRARAVVLAAESVGEKPLIVGVGDMSTSQVLSHIKVAERVDAAAILVAPVSYQPLTANEVFNHFRIISESTDLPVIVYDNPGTTHFTFDLNLYARISALPGVKSIKIPPTAVAGNNPQGAISAIRAEIADDVSLGISGDGAAARGLAAGCDVWYSVVAGTLPEVGEEIMQPIRSGNPERALDLSAKYQPLWELYAECGGSVRVMAAIAEIKGWVGKESLPKPLQSLNSTLDQKIQEVMKQLNIG